MFDVTVLTELTAKIGGLDEHLYADDDLLAGVKAIETAVQYLHAAQGALLGELEARGTTDMVSGHRTASWLAHETGIAPAAAKARVRLATALRLDLPETDRAVRGGRLCSDRAKVMANAINDRIATEFRAMEASLIAESAHMTFGEWAQRVALVAALLDQDGLEPADDPNNNKLRLKGGRDGMKLAGILVGDLATTTKAAVEQIAAELWRQYRDDSERTNGEIAVPSRATLLAMALAEAVRRGLMVKADGTAVKKPKVEATLVLHAEDPDLVYIDGKPLIRGSATALGTAARVGDSWGLGLGRLIGDGFDDGFELDGGQSAEGCLSPSAVVGALDPGHDRDPQLVAGRPSLAIEDVLLEEREERLHRRVVAGRADLAHRPDHVVAGERSVEFPGTKLRSAIRMQDAPGDVTAAGNGVVERRHGDAGLHPI